MTSAALPTSTPSAQGTDADGILAFIDALEASATQDPHSLMILRHGHLIAQGWWTPYAPQRRHLLYSLSKSFTSAAAGLAFGDGLLRLDDPIIAYFPELDADITNARSRRILVRHVASMSTGHTEDTLGKALALDPSDPVRGFLLLPPDQEPGSVFAYNQPATYTLAAIVQKLTGGTLIDYLRPRLLDPLGIAPVGWQEFPPGRNLGFSGLYATTDAIARLGLLNLQRGTWQGDQLLPEEWVDQASVAQIPTTVPFPIGEGEVPDNPDWQQGYGFQFWMARHGYRGDGAFGQFMLVLPEQDAVVAITSQTENMQETLDLAWQLLLPAFGDATRGVGSVDADRHLSQRLSELRLPMFTDRASTDTAPADTAPTGTAPTDAAPTDAAPTGRASGDAPPEGIFSPEGGRCAAQPSLTSVRIRRDGEHATIELTDVGGVLSAPIGREGWAVADDAPLAVCGRVERPGVLRAEVVFIETPHRLHITCDAASGTFTATWMTLPLRAENTPLTDLATPDRIG